MQSEMAVCRHHIRVPGGDLHAEGRTDRSLKVSGAPAISGCEAPAETAYRALFAHGAEPTLIACAPRHDALPHWENFYWHPPGVGAGSR